MYRVKHVFCALCRLLLLAYTRYSRTKKKELQLILTLFFFPFQNELVSLEGEFPILFLGAKLYIKVDDPMNFDLIWALIFK